MSFNFNGIQGQNIEIMNTLFREFRGKKIKIMNTHIFSVWDVHLSVVKLQLPACLQSF